MNDDHAAIEALRDRLRNGYDMRLAAREAHAAGAPVAIIAATIRRTPQTVYQWLRMDLADILAAPSNGRPKQKGIIYMTPLTAAGESSTLTSSRTELSQ